MSDLSMALIFVVGKCTNDIAGRKHEIEMLKIECGCEEIEILPIPN